MVMPITSRADRYQWNSHRSRFTATRASCHASVATTNALQVIDCRDAPGPLHDVRVAAPAEPISSST